MRKLNTSNITPTVGQPIKGGTLEHLQWANQEIFDAIGKFICGGGYSSSVCYIIYGCELTIGGGNYNIAAGAVFFNGEVYLVDATTFTAPVGAQVIIGTITTTNYTDSSADPVALTDGNTANVHEIRKMVVSKGTSGAGTADFDDWVRLRMPQTVVSFSGTMGSIDVSFQRDSITHYSNSVATMAVTYDFDNAVIGATSKLVWYAQTGSITQLSGSGSGVVVYLECTAAGIQLSTSSLVDNKQLAFYFTYCGFDGTDHHVAIKIYEYTS